MRDPVGFLLTWSTYGAWLHGDQRGSVDRAHNAFGSPDLPVNASRELAARGRLGGGPRTLSHDARAVVHRAIEAHGAYRRWEVLAVNVRTNHAHVVVRFAGVSPETMMGEMKAWAARRLREAGLADGVRRIWTRHGSTRYIWNEASLGPAITYVLEAQDVPR